MSQQEITSSAKKAGKKRLSTAEKLSIESQAIIGDLNTRRTRQSTRGSLAPVEEPSAKKAKLETPKGRGVKKANGTTATKGKKSPAKKTEKDKEDKDQNGSDSNDSDEDVAVKKEEAAEKAVESSDEKASAEKTEEKSDENDTVDSKTESEDKEPITSKATNEVGDKAAEATNKSEEDGEKNAKEATTDVKEATAEAKETAPPAIDSPSAPSTSKRNVPHDIYTMDTPPPPSDDSPVAVGE